MTKDRRVSRKGRQSYNTKSNRIRTVRTPGGKLAVQIIPKLGTVPKCGDTGAKLHGIKRLRPLERKWTPKRDKTVARTYGGTLSAAAVRKRVISAFLNEERIVKERAIKKRN